MYVLSRQKATKEFLAEIFPLLQKHYDEVAHFKDIPLDPDFDRYVKFEEIGIIRLFTARHFGRVIGYACYFVNSNPHYKTSIQANQDVIFIDPAYRGFGKEFIDWCDEQLRLEGIQVVYQHVKAKHNFGPLLERLGYELVDHIYARRLDG